MELFVLGNLFVLIKGLVPLFIVQRWQGAQQGFPLSNRKTRIGKAGDATKNYLKDNHDNPCYQPNSYGAS